MKETGHAAFPAGEGNVEVWWLRARCGAVHQVSREVFLIGFLGPQLREYEKAKRIPGSKFWKDVIESSLQAKVGRWLVTASGYHKWKYSMVCADSKCSSLRLWCVTVSQRFTKLWLCCLRAISFSSHVSWAQAIQLSYKSFYGNTQYPLLCWSSLPLFSSNRGCSTGRPKIG